MPFRLPVVALAVAVTVAACGVDGEQARVCERLIPAFEPGRPNGLLGRLNP